MIRVHGPACRCADCRHERFNPGPPSNPRRLNWYGHYKRSPMIRRRREMEKAAALALYNSIFGGLKP